MLFEADVDTGVGFTKKFVEGSREQFPSLHHVLRRGEYESVRGSAFKYIHTLL
jgi:hypothetical protein